MVCKAGLVSQYVCTRARTHTHARAHAHTRTHTHSAVSFS